MSWAISSNSSTDRPSVPGSRGILMASATQQPKLEYVSKEAADVRLDTPLNRPEFPDPLRERKVEPRDIDRSTTHRSCVSVWSRWSPRRGPNYPSDKPTIRAVAENLGIGTAE